MSVWIVEFINNIGQPGAAFIASPDGADAAVTVSVDLQVKCITRIRELGDASDDL